MRRREGEVGGRKRLFFRRLVEEEREAEEERGQCRRNAEQGAGEQKRREKKLTSRRPPCGSLLPSCTGIHGIRRFLLRRGERGKGPWRPLELGRFAVWCRDEMAEQEDRERVSRRK